MTYVNSDTLLPGEAKIRQDHRLLLLSQYGVTSLAELPDVALGRIQGFVEGRTVDKRADR